MRRERYLTTGNITTSLWLFALPLMLGNVMQQLYNLVDTWVVGRYIGDTALAAVGSSYTILTFLTSVIIGLCLGSSAFLSMAYGRRDLPAMRNGIFLSCSTIGVLSLCLMLAFYRFLDPIIFFLRVPKRRLQKYAHLSVLCIFRLFCHIFIQLFFQRSARHRKFSHSAVVSRRLCRVKYFFGFVLCHCFALGHYGRSARHCRFAMRLRHWHHRILSKKVSAVPRDAQRHVLEQRKSPQHSLAVRLHLFVSSLS